MGEWDYCEGINDGLININGYRGSIIIVINLTPLFGLWGSEVFGVLDCVGWPSILFSLLKGVEWSGGQACGDVER